MATKKKYESMRIMSLEGSVLYKNEGFTALKNGKPDPDAELKFGPNITDWPAMDELGEDMLIQVASLITDPVTTTDELIPSGETSSYRSNPIGLSEFALSRRVPEYVARSKAVRALEEAREKGEVADEVKAVLEALE